MRRALCNLAVATFLVLAGCGDDEAPRLLTIDAGDVGTGEVVVTEEGRGRCDATDFERIDRASLAQMRAIVRDLDALPGDRSVFHGPPNRRIYRFTTRNSTVIWALDARGAPKVTDDATILADDLLNELCAGGAGADTGDYDSAD